MLGLEYATKGTMEVDGRKIVVITKDDQGKPDLAKSALTEAYEDDGADIAVGTTSSPAAIAMLPVAEEHKKILIVEPAVADQITGEKWNRYIFRTAPQFLAGRDLERGRDRRAGRQHRHARRQDNAFGRDGVAAFKAALAKTGATLVAEEYAPANTTDFTGVGQRLFDALKDKPGKKMIWMVWAGATNPLDKLADLDPGRYGIELRPAATSCRCSPPTSDFPASRAPPITIMSIPKNPANDWLVAEHKKRFNAPPDFFTAGGFAAAEALVTALDKAKSTDSEKLIADHGGHGVRHAQGQDDLPQGGPSGAAVDVRLQDQGRSERRLGDPGATREIKIEDMDIPIRNKR